MTDSIPPESMMRWTFRLALGAVPIGLTILGLLWALHQSGKAHASTVADHGARLTNVEDKLDRIDRMADDIAAIRAGLAAERGWRQGLMQSSLPGAEGED